MAGERERPSSREGAKPSDLAEDGDARVVRAPPRTTSWKEPHFGATRWVPPAHAPGPVGTPRSILAVGGAKRKRGERGGEENEKTREQNADAYSRATKFDEAPGEGADAPAATRRRLDLLRSLGVVKSNGGVPSTYNVSAAFAKETSFDEAAFAASSPSPNVSVVTTTSGRVKLVVRGSKGRIGAFRSPGATPRLRGRLRAAATDPKIVRAELFDLPPDATDAGVAAAARPRRRKRARTPAPSSRPPRFRSGPPTPRLRASRSAPGRCVARRAGRGGKRTTTPCWARRCATSTAGKRVRARRGIRRMRRRNRRALRLRRRSRSGRPPLRTGMERRTSLGTQNPPVTSQGRRRGSRSGRRRRQPSQRSARAPRPPSRSRRRRTRRRRSRSAAQRHLPAAACRWARDPPRRPPGGVAFARGDRGDVDCLHVFSFRLVSRTRASVVRSTY